MDRLHEVLVAPALQAALCCPPHLPLRRYGGASQSQLSAHRATPTARLVGSSRWLRRSTWCCCWFSTSLILPSPFVGSRPVSPLVPLATAVAPRLVAGSPPPSAPAPWFWLRHWPCSGCWCQRPCPWSSPRPWFCWPPHPWFCHYCFLCVWLAPLAEAEV